MTAMDRGDMKTNAEIRRDNARLLAAELGSTAALAKRLEMSDSQLGQLIGINPRRNIGPKIARRIEEVCGRPTGWLDVEHTATTPTSLRDFQLTEAKSILDRLDDVELSRALLWLQEHVARTMDVGSESAHAAAAKDVKHSTGGRRTAGHERTGTTE